MIVLYQLNFTSLMPLAIHYKSGLQEQFKKTSNKLYSINLIIEGRVDMTSCSLVKGIYGVVKGRRR